MRIVLDTSVLIAALRSSRGASAQVLELVFNHEVTLCMDYKLACEYRDVALRREQLAASSLEDWELERFVTRLEQFAEAIEIELRIRPLSPDPADDMVLDVAINGHADVVVTHNAKHFSSPGERFGIAVMSPATFLRHLLEET